MTQIKVYFEGASTGAFSRSSKIEARTAFETFARRLGLIEMPRFIPCGARNSAYEDFVTALEIAHADVLPLLLVDSEGPLLSDDRWEHLQRRTGDGWERPVAANSEHVHFMAQCMETWLIADQAALQKFYHNDDFLDGQLPKSANLEVLAKHDVFLALERATMRCSRKGKYKKGHHSWKLLAILNPASVEKRCPHARIFCDLLRKLCGTA